MSEEKLDFSGGPWKLRNGDTVNCLQRFFNIFIEKPASNREWDIEGNCRVNDINDNSSRATQFDLMEKLNNWKYNKQN